MSGDSRISSLSGILAGKEPRPRLAAVTAAPDIESEPLQPADPEAIQQQDIDAGRGDHSPPPEEPGSTELPKVRTPGRAKPRTRPDATVDTRVRVVARMDPDVRDALSAAARTQHVPLAAIVFDAVEQAHLSGQLEQLLREPIQAPSGALFSRPTLPVAQAKVTVELRMTRADQRALDGIVAKYAADTRTRLITVALRNHLNLEGTSQPGGSADRGMQ